MRFLQGGAYPRTVARVVLLICLASHEVTTSHGVGNFFPIPVFYLHGSQKSVRLPSEGPFQQVTWSSSVASENRGFVMTTIKLNSRSKFGLLLCVAAFFSFVAPQARADED